jgi:integrase
MPTKTSAARDKTDHANDHAVPKKYSRARFRGVQILPPDGRRLAWALRARDPDAKKLVQRSLTHEEQKSERTIEEAARALYVKNLARRQELRLGASPLIRSKIPDLIRRYYEAVQLAPKTLLNYEAVTTAFIEWCASHQVKTADQLTRGRLREFALTRQNVGKRQIVKGGRKGQCKQTRAQRQNSTINKELRALRAVLIELQRLELVALSPDQIRDSLRLLREAPERKPHLTLEQCQELLDACMAHDQDPINLKAAALPIMFLLMTGMRVSEACAVTGTMLDVKRNVIALPAAITKPRRPRDVDCSVSLWLTLWLKRWAHKGKATVLGTTPSSISQLLERLHAGYGAPKCSPHMIRRTTGTILACSAIFERGTLHRTAGQLGHSISMCEKRYAGQMRCPEGDTLEEVLGLTSDKDIVGMVLMD